MSRYVLMQEQLDALLNQIKDLNRSNEAKTERIKELELKRIYASKKVENEDLVSAIGKMEEEIHRLKTSNKALSDVNEERSKKIRDLEMLLEEERKLREYSESFAREVELQCAEESMIRKLTTELCQLQKDEIEIDNKRILELQKKIKNLGRNTKKEISGRDEQLNAEVRTLRGKFLEIYDHLNKNTRGRPEDEKQKSMLRKWLREIPNVMEELENIQKIREDLHYLKHEIEDRRRQSPFLYS